ncbi:hypothetical protein Pfo_023091 [Paulownia fortunei]|nr:hypothetical protein Pfo_023091 [Paulownia fortunei]
MKEVEHKNLMKKMISQLLLSVSIFSLVFSYSSLFSSPLLMYSQKLNYFSSESFRLLSRATNKNCIFLICNGLLFFLAKTSGFASSPSGFDLNDMLQKRIGDGLQTAQEIESETLLEKDVILEESDYLSTEEEENEEEMKGSNEEAELECSSERTKEVSIFIAESDEEEVENDESESKNCWLFYDDEEEERYGGEEEEEEEDDDETEMLSKEELNQKFEDFIRRMKEEFRINEARQQLVMVK